MCTHASVFWFIVLSVFELKIQKDSKQFLNEFEMVLKQKETKRKQTKEKGKTLPLLFPFGPARAASLASLFRPKWPASTPSSLSPLAGKRVPHTDRRAPQVSASNLSSSRGQAGLHIGTEPNPVYHGICCRDRLPCSYKSSGTFPACPFPHL